MTATIKMIAAMTSKTRAIGKKDGGIPWDNISEDMINFKRTTMSHPIVMGRKTWETFRGRPLPGRINIVVTRNTSYVVPAGVHLASSVIEALNLAKGFDQESIFVIGGAEIYKEALPYTKYLYLTIIDTEIDGPVKFPIFEDRHHLSTIIKKSYDEKYDLTFTIVAFNTTEQLPEK